MAVINVNGYDLFYTDSGTGIPLIFVHGSVNDYRTWKNQIDIFSQYFHVFVYSRRYHYPNKPPADYNDYTVDVHSDDLIDFINNLSLANVNLVGSSYGAYTSLLTAVKHPHLVKTLVLGEPPILPLLIRNFNNPFEILSLALKDFQTAASLMSFGITAMKPAQKKLREGMDDEALQLFAKGVLGKGEYEKIPDKGRKSIKENADAFKAEVLGPGFTYIPEDRIRNVKIPSLLVYGSNSPQFFHSILNKLKSILPESESVIIQNASHRIHGDNPQDYNKAVLQFLLKHNHMPK